MNKWYWITAGVIVLIVVVLWGRNTLSDTRSRPGDLIKSVRVDLSSMDAPKDQTALIKQMLDQLTAVHANTVYLSPWADGGANYKSAVAPESDWGRRQFVEQFIAAAHGRDIQVFGWFVVAKDDFPPTIHPEWYAHTIDGKPYNQEDSPGIFLPFADLANQNYINYHLKVVREIAEMPFDGYVISEPVISWEENSSVPVSKRAGIVTSFVRQTISVLRPSHKPIVITVYDEPLANGKLKSDQEIKNWLGLDLPALVALKPDYIEIQDLFNDFEFQQSPAWTTSFIKQYRDRVGTSTALLVSIQGWDGDHGPLTDTDFIKAMHIAMTTPGVRGVSFYAYHLASATRWTALAQLWQ